MYLANVYMFRSVTARSAISLHSSRFYGGIDIDETGAASRHNVGDQQYTGPASPMIDAAWEQLIGRRFSQCAA